ncbi:unnamed protein product, partial [Iphiclides podalirius]
MAENSPLQAAAWRSSGGVEGGGGGVAQCLMSLLRSVRAVKRARYGHLRDVRRRSPSIPGTSPLSPPDKPT